MDYEYPLTSLRVSDLDMNDRPREKALASGVNTLSDTELLAIVLGSGSEGLSVIDLSRHILASCDNSLSRLSRMSVSELTRNFRGIGPAKAVSLLSAINLGMRCATENSDPLPQIRSAADVFTLMRPGVSMIDHEEFWVLLLSQSNRVKHKIMISRGGLTSTVVDARMILRHAIVNSCPGIILVHNHPSENPMPSGQDDNLTKRISEGARLLDLRVLDHVIIAGGKYYSYADSGRM